MRAFLGLPREIPSRDQQNGEFYGDGSLGWIYVLLCNWANHADGKAPLRQGGIIARGQVVLSQEELVKASGFGRTVVRRCLARLVDSGKINQQTNQQGTIITVNNYAELFLSSEDDRPTNRPATDQRPTSDRPHQDKETRRQEDKETACSGAPPAAGPHDLAQLWNSEARGGMRKTQGAGAPGSRRWNSAKARLQDMSLEEWRPIIARVAASRFCRGEVPGRDGGKPWVANFDWLIRPDTQMKILEGAYDDSGGETTTKRGIKTATSIGDLS